MQKDSMQHNKLGGKGGVSKASKAIYLVERNHRPQAYRRNTCPWILVLSRQRYWYSIRFSASSPSRHPMDWVPERLKAKDGGSRQEVS